MSKPLCGNVNTYYNYTSCDNKATSANGSLVCNIPSQSKGGSPGSNDKISSVRTGLLPAFLSFSGKTRQNDLDVGFTISLQPGTATGHALGTTDQENRQTFLTVGDKSWGSFKFGRDLGLFGADAILSDVTILGTGTSFAGGNYRGGAAQGGGQGGVLGNSTSGTSLGRIGIGYLYADWIAQVSYASPNWNGFSFAAAVVEPYQTIGAGNSGGAQNDYSSPGFQGKVTYEWAGDVSGKVWASGWGQRVNGVQVSATRSTDYTARIFDIGAKVSVADFELLGYYYNGSGAGTTGFLVRSNDSLGKERDSDGGYVQAAYKIPGVGTKIAVSYGESNLDETSQDKIDARNLVRQNSSWVVGAYHPLTKSLNLVAEYTRTRSEAQHGVSSGGAQDNTEDNVSLGAILFF